MRINQYIIPNLTTLTSSIIMYQISFPCGAFQNRIIPSSSPSMPFIIHAPPTPSSSHLTNAASSFSSTVVTVTTASKLTYNKTTGRFPSTTTKWNNRSRGGAAVVIRAKAGTDYYSTLNVSSNATLQEIKSSYRKLARKVPFFLSGYSIFFLILIFDSFTW